MLKIMGKKIFTLKIFVYLNLCFLMLNFMIIHLQLFIKESPQVHIVIVGEINTPKSNLCLCKLYVSHLILFDLIAATVCYPGIT